MNPQPPVTSMRIDAVTSSETEAAPVVSPDSPPEAKGQWARWKAWAAQIDWIPIAILVFAAFLRLLLLGMKPPHFDEGINGWFVDQMTKNGFYRYDPTNYHGPLHFYIIFLSQTLFGRNFYALRVPVVLASLGAVWLALKYDRVIPRPV